MMMGVETPIPPFAMDAAAPDGASCAADQLPKKETVICPAVPKERP